MRGETERDVREEMVTGKKLTFSTTWLVAGEANLPKQLCEKNNNSLDHKHRYNTAQNTVEPPNKGHIGTRSFVLYREVSFIRRLKCTGIIGIGMSRFVLYREVFFVENKEYTVELLITDPPNSGPPPYNGPPWMYQLLFL